MQFSHTHLDGRNPFPQPFLPFPRYPLLPIAHLPLPINILFLVSMFAFGNHDARWAARLEHDSAGEGFGRFCNGVDFLARRHVVRFEEGAVEHGLEWG